MSELPLDVSKCAACRRVPPTAGHDLCAECYAKWRSQEQNEQGSRLCACCHREYTSGNTKFDLCQKCHQEWSKATGVPSTAATFGSMGGFGTGGAPPGTGGFGGGYGSMSGFGTGGTLTNPSGSTGGFGTGFGKSTAHPNPPGPSGGFPMATGAGPGRTASPGPAGGFPMAGGAGGPQPSAGSAEDQKQFSVASYSVNSSDFVDYLFVSATFSYKHYFPASFHFFVPSDEHGLTVLARFSVQFLQRKLVRFDDAQQRVVLTSPMLDMDYDRFLRSSDQERQALFITFERNL